MMRTDWMMSTAILRVVVDDEDRLDMSTTRLREVLDDEDRLDDEYSNTESGGG